MADLKNLVLSGGTAPKYNGDEQVQFIAGDSHQVTIKSPLATLRLEDANNTALTPNKQNISHCTCNGGATNGTAGDLPSSDLLPRKVPNHNGFGHPNKKPAVSLTHLPKRPPVDIEFKNLVYNVFEGRLKGYKTILKSINGKFRSGELTAIMGPSGAGKSTLMNVLAGYKTSYLSGSVLVNGKERNLRKFRKMSCYIMQDDQLLPRLTIYEAMMVSANLKLGKDLTAAQKKVVIEEIIQSMGLSDASNTQTHCLSGGQRKRLSIALELVNNPPVMFFDEPTSGLDSSSCFQCLNLLKSLSRGGRTIICTIHQPSARLFEMFDFLYLLVEGQCIYRGIVGGLVPFLSSMGLNCPSYHNPADYVMEVACGEHGNCVHHLVSAVADGTCEDYYSKRLAITNGTQTNGKKSSPTEPTELNHTPNGVAKPPGGNAVINMPVSCTTSLLDSTESIEQKVGFPTNSFVQFWILFKRTFLSQKRDTTLTILRFVSHVIVGLLIGVIYYDIGNEASEVISNAGCVFFIVMFLMFTAMMPMILTFPVDMAVFIREHLNYWYSLKAYYVARTLIDVPFQIAYSIVYASLVYFLTSQPYELERFLMFLNICILISLVSQSIGLLIGAAVSVENGVFIGPVMTVPVVLFSGFFINFDAIPAYLKFLSYASYCRYGFEGAMISVYGYNRAKLKCSQDYCHYRSPQKFLEQMSMEKAVYWIDAVALLGFFISLRIIAYFVLRLKLRSLR